MSTATALGALARLRVQRLVDRLALHEVLALLQMAQLGAAQVLVDLP